MHSLMDSLIKDRQLLEARKRRQEKEMIDATENFVVTSRELNKINEAIATLQTAMENEQ